MNYLKWAISKTTTRNHTCRLLGVGLSSHITKPHRTAAIKPWMRDPAIGSLLPTNPECAYHEVAVHRRGSCSTHVYDAVTVCHSTKHSFSFSILTLHSNIIQPETFEIHSNIATTASISSLTKASHKPASTMDNAALVHPQIPGLRRGPGFHRQQRLRHLWARRDSILLRLLEYTLVFLVITRVSWACESYDEVETILMVLGTLTCSYFGQPRGWRSNRTDREAGYKLLKGCVWPAVYILTLHFGLAMYLDNEPL